MRCPQMFSMHTCIRWDFDSFQLTLRAGVAYGCAPGLQTGACGSGRVWGCRRVRAALGLQTMHTCLRWDFASFQLTLRAGVADGCAPGLQTGVCGTGLVDGSVSQT